ncbi:MAG: PLP-dependent aminotransferase family protein [Pseudomonadota bacterium]
MRDLLFSVDKSSKRGLQSQIREILVSAILNGHLKPGERLPSTRQMADRLDVSRNTVVLAYQLLIDGGYLQTSERSGYFVNETLIEMPSLAKEGLSASDQAVSNVDWASRIVRHPADQRNIEKPENWQQFRFPFIYGQSDPDLFPTSEWRECVYRALGRKWLGTWSADTLDRDDEMLVEQIRSRILPRRGILVGSEQILVTLGVQQGLYLLANLLAGRGIKVAVEEPGYPDARNIFRLATSDVGHLDVDGDGLVINEKLDGAGLVYTTPSHQLPTTVTMTPERREALLKQASERDFIIVEDDYELETNYVDRPLPSLKSQDADGRVIYLGSFSKTLFPGLRLGFLVAPPEFIKQARALRRLMVRHPPTSNQSAAALFLSLGYYDVHVRKLHRIYRERWDVMGRALAHHMSDVQRPRSIGGSSYWLKVPAGIDTTTLAEAAMDQDVFIEPGSVYFDREPPPNNFLRLGFSSIPTERIDEGIERLAGVMRQLG